MNIKEKHIVIDEESMLTMDKEVAKQIVERMDDTCRIVVIGDFTPEPLELNGLTVNKNK